MNNNKQAYIRKEIYPLAQILPLIPDTYRKNIQRIILDGDRVKISSKRLIVFKKSVKCVKCGLEGLFFAKEKIEGHTSYHLNLYAVKDGEEILMTKDHIIPLSKNGQNTLSNLQTMCCICNLEKGDTLEDNKD